VWPAIALSALITVQCVKAQEPAAGADTTKPTKMPRDADPGWEVATVKPSSPSDKGDRIHLHGRHWTFERETAEMMLLIGYNVHKSQIAGAPAWVKTQQWDVDGLADVDGEPNLSQLQSMVRKVLVERFGLKLHREQREMPVFALTVGKGGPKLTVNTSDPNGLMDQENRGGSTWRMEQLKNTSMPELALILQFHVDRPILDQTGLKGRYDFQVKWTTDESQLPGPDAPPGLFTAIQEQLGLKLEPVRAMAPVLVVDAVERPGAN